MRKSAIICSFLILMLGTLKGQVAFPDLVSRAFGSDQELVNGILFSNQFWGIEGHPYFLDGRFREGSVYINHQHYTDIRLRYNLYTERVEIDYISATGNRYQYMSVAAHIPSFSLEGIEFIYRQFPGETPAYYQVISEGNVTCFIGWKKELEYASSNTTSTYRFSQPSVRYRIILDGKVISFHNRKTFKKSFPDIRKKEISSLLKKYTFSFKHPTAQEAETLMRAAMPLYETDNLP